MSIEIITTTPTGFVIYESYNETLIATTAKEPEALLQLFEVEGRDLEQYDRRVINEDWVEISSEVRVW